MISLILVQVKMVKANSYDIYLGTNASETLKTGDIIELYAGISAVYPGEQVSEQKFLFILDRDVFDIPTNDDEPSTLTVREGWKRKSFAVSKDQFSVKIFSESDEYNITNDLASGNSLDSTNAVLVTAKLKVKDVNNQTTKIQLVNEHNYVKELNFTIHNSSSNNYLSSIDVQGYQLNDNFDKNKTEYNVYVPYEIEKVNISASVEDSAATLSGTGEKNLLVGKNSFDLVVTAENGVKKTYTVNVIRTDADGVTSLSKVLVIDSNKKEVLLDYDDKTNTYTGIVTSDVSFVTFDIECDGKYCTVDKLDTEKLNDGVNEFKFSVTSQSGSKVEYKIIINKEKSKEEVTETVETTGNNKNYITMYLFIGLGALAIAFIVLAIIYYFKKPKRSKK